MGRHFNRQACTLHAMDCALGTLKMLIWDPVQPCHPLSLSRYWPLLPHWLDTWVMQPPSHPSSTPSRPSLCSLMWLLKRLMLKGSCKLFNFYFNQTLGLSDYYPDVGWKHFYTVVWERQVSSSSLLLTSCESSSISHFSLAAAS